MVAVLEPAPLFNVVKLLLCAPLNDMSVPVTVPSWLLFIFAKAADVALFKIVLNTPVLTTLIPSTELLFMLTVAVEAAPVL